MGTQLSLRKKGAHPQFTAHFYFGQTAGCIKMPLGMEVSLGLGSIVLDGDPPPNKKGHSSPHSSPPIRPMSIVAKRLDGSTWHLAMR